MKPETGVVVAKRKLHRAKTGRDIAATMGEYKDPSHDSEKALNPLDYKRTSFVKAVATTPIWTNLRLSSRHIRELFGEPTRICKSHLEYVLQIPTREIVKIVVDSKGAVTIHGFQRTQTLEKWVNRLVHA